MKLIKKVSTDPWFTRSINLTRDIGSSDSITSYISTSSTKTTLDSIVNGFDEKKYSRAWTLIGPYGSGKSSFGLYLNALASSESTGLQTKAFEKLQSFDNAFIGKVKKTFAKKKILKIVLTGTYDQLENHLGEAISNEISKAQKNNKFSKPFTKTIDEFNRIKNPNASEIIKLLSSLQDELNKQDYSGIFITIDELGKFIEFAGAKKKDIFLLQEIAELSVKEHSVPLFFFGMLHQSLDYYAQHLSIEIKNEWKKIQGRFEEIAFVESTEQMIRLLGEAIKTSFTPQENSKIRSLMKDSVYYFLDQKVFPNLSGKRESVELFHSASPLHPSSSAILPILAQKLGQNERTVFTYLGSKEAYGFQDQLAKKESSEMIMPSDIFDYFYTNQSSYINDHVVNKRWIEILNALDRLNRDEIQEIELLKTIGLINLVGSFSSLRCSKELLASIFPAQTLEKNLNSLEKKSLVIFRKFNSEYRVWQGSDFDFESSIRFELEQLHDFDLTRELNNILPAKPLVARKFSIQSGTLRYFDTQYASVQNIDQLLGKQDSTNPNAFIIFEDGESLSKALITNIQTKHENTLIIKVSDNAFIVNETKQLKALNNLLERSDDLSSDPIARQEVISQIDQSKKKIESELKQIFLPESSEWHWEGKKLTFKDKFDFQAKLSEILNSVFLNSPTVNNELINKDSISSQGQAARVRLMKDMLEQADKIDLGYLSEKAPPEKGMYKAIFKDHKLSETVDGVTKFINPVKGSQFFTVFELIKKLLSSSDKPLTFSKLSDELRAAPYGIKRGLHPVIFLAFYFANEEHIAIYEGSLYKPYFNSESIQRLASKAPAFSFKYHSFDGQNKIIEEYANVLSKSPNEKNVLSIARRLSKTMSMLPEYTMSTQSGLSREASRFRSAFLYSKSPLDLLMSDIPSAIGFDEEKLKDSAQLESFSSMLNTVLSELKGCYSSLLLNQKKNFCLAFEQDYQKDLADIRPELFNRLVMLEDYTIDTKSIKPFLRKLLDRDSPDQEWFESLLAFLVKKHPTKWNDENTAEAELALKNISDRIKDLSKLKVYESSNKISSSHDLDIFVMRIKKKGFDEKDVITTLSQSERENYEKFKKEIMQVLFKYSKNSEDQLSLISPLVDDILNGNISKKDLLKLVKDKD